MLHLSLLPQIFSLYCKVLPTVPSFYRPLIPLFLPPSFPPCHSHLLHPSIYPCICPSICLCSLQNNADSPVSAIASRPPNPNNLLVHAPVCLKTHTTKLGCVIGAMMTSPLVNGLIKNSQSVFFHLFLKKNPKE